MIKSAPEFVHLFRLGMIHSGSIRGLIRRRLGRWPDSFGSWLMSLHMTLQAANLVLQTAPGTLECIVDRKINVGVALVGIRLVPNIDFLFVRQSEPDVDLEKTARPAVLAWTL